MENEILRIGPAGNSDKFYAEGYKHTYQAFQWLKNMGLNAFEYSFGKGVRLNMATADVIRQEAEKNGVQMSVHAPYYINFSGLDPDKLTASRKYLVDSVVTGEKLGAVRCIFHPGSCSKMDRNDALSRAKEQLALVISELDELGYNTILCPETMGKINQLGTLEEVVEMCKIDSRLVPTIDFGHLHARSLGGIKSKADYREILDTIGNGLGEDRLRKIHVHFSKIEYSSGGEKMHRTFAEAEYGPDFQPLAELMIEYKMHPVIICESKGTMAEDALTMLNIYNDCLK